MTRKPSYCYNDLKQLARELDRPVSTLIALAPVNDPFYVTPARQTAAAWFARIWGKFRIGAGAHIRRIHYVLISQKKPVLTSDGMPFENTEAYWQSLLAASKDARYLALVPITDFVDRRNAEAILNFRETRQPASYVGGSDIDDMPEPPRIMLIEGAPAQRFQIEIWAEKTTDGEKWAAACHSRPGGSY